MKLYLMQHGSALPETMDPDRPLSAKGIAEVNKVAAFLKPLGLRVGTIWHCGKTRSAQTADLIAPVVDSQRGIEQRNDLDPDGSIGTVVRDIKAAGEDVMIVGHMPFLGKLASELLTGRQSADTIGFQRGGVVCLEIDQHGVWSLRWMVVPAILP